MTLSTRTIRQNLRQWLSLVHGCVSYWVSGRDAVGHTWDTCTRTPLRREEMSLAPRLVRRYYIEYNTRETA